MPGHGFSHGALPSLVHTQSLWWPEAIVEFTGPVRWDHKARMKGFCRRWGNFPVLSLWGHFPPFQGAQLPVLLQCHKGKSAQRTLSMARILVPESKPWVRFGQRVFMTRGKCPLLCLRVVYKRSLYESLINRSGDCAELTDIAWDHRCTDVRMSS